QPGGSVHGHERAHPCSEADAPDPARGGGSPGRHPSCSVGPRGRRQAQGQAAAVMRAVTYHRVSTLDQHADAARTELREAASRLGAELIEEIEETGSGARNDRPGLARVMDLARRHKVDVVLVSKLDRFGRSALDLLANVRELETAAVRFIATSQGIDIRPGGDPMSRLLLTMLAAIAEFER